VTTWRTMARAAGWPDERLDELRLATHSHERVVGVHPRALLIAGRQPGGAEYEQTFTRERGDAWAVSRAQLEGYARVHTEDDGR
jgi:hypothetical protein